MQKAKQVHRGLRQFSLRGHPRIQGHDGIQMVHWGLESVREGCICQRCCKVLTNNNVKPRGLHGSRGSLSLRQCGGPKRHNVAQGAMLEPVKNGV